MGANTWPIPLRTSPTVCVIQKKDSELILKWTVASLVSNLKSSPCIGYHFKFGPRPRVHILHTYIEREKIQHALTGGGGGGN